MIDAIPVPDSWPIYDNPFKWYSLCLGLEDQFYTTFEGELKREIQEQRDCENSALTWTTSDWKRPAVVVFDKLLKQCTLDFQLPEFTSLTAQLDDPAKTFFSVLPLRLFGSIDWSLPTPNGGREIFIRGSNFYCLRAKQVLAEWGLFSEEALGFFSRYDEIDDNMITRDDLHEIMALALHCELLRHFPNLVNENLLIKQGYLKTNRILAVQRIPRRFIPPEQFTYALTICTATVRLYIYYMGINGDIKDLLD